MAAVVVKDGRPRAARPAVCDPFFIIGREPSHDHRRRLKWVPPFPQGQVRDHRVRWVLNEVGWPYQVRLIDAAEQRSAAYRRAQPFGQVPVLEEDGRPTLLDSAAIVLDVALRGGRLLPAEDGQRAMALSDYFAALNSIEPFLMNAAEVEYFIADEEHKRLRRPAVMAMAQQRLGELERALGDRPYLVGDDFTIADLMNASVLKMASSMQLLSGTPKLAAWQGRMLRRPAYQRAVADQCAAFGEHTAADMKWG